METGILEFMEHGHFTLVDSLCRIFSSDASGKITLLVHPNNAANAEKLAKKLPHQHIEVISGSPEELLEKAKEMPFDRIYIVTPEKHFRKIYQLADVHRCMLFIHNIDEWFDQSLKKRIYELAQNTRLNPAAFKANIYFLKRFFFSVQKKKIVHRIISGEHKIVVLNQNLKELATKYIPGHKIEIVPFSVFDDSLSDLSATNNKLRVCIPGILSALRRDYDSVFNLLQENPRLKDQIQLDLLGGVSKSSSERSAEVLTRAEALKEAGYDIIIRNVAYVHLDEFDTELAKADIILGNMHIQLNKYSKYGETKESGIPFTMVRAGKPGLLPTEYRTLPEISSSTVNFSSYNELGTILLNLADRPAEIQQLKAQARINSEYFAPQKLYNKLINEI